MFADFSPSLTRAGKLDPGEAVYAAALAAVAPTEVEDFREVVTMRTALVWTFAVVLAMAPVGLRADEENIALDKLPGAVTAAVKGRFPGAEVKGAGKEVEGGKTYYEVTLKHKGRGIDVTLTPEGTITEIEKQIEAKGLPRAVAAALEGKYSGAKYKTIEEIVKVRGGEEKLEYYEVLLVTPAGKKLEVCVTPAGKVEKEEDKSRGKD